MEAMAAGVPCISTDCPCGGPRELFGEDASDKLVPCNDSAQLSEAICKVLETTKDGMTEKGMPKHLSQTGLIKCGKAMSTI